MSEYQYYEFVAIDHPLTPKQQGELRAMSTRARITSSSFVNDYQWGDLKGDPQLWMDRYFDAHLYLANWGTRRIALRLPRAALTPEDVARYCVGEPARSWATRTHVIVDLQSDDEDGDEWCEPEGRLAAIGPVRTELASGDRRLLYLAWLLCVQSRELDDDELEPPVPPGLAELSGPLQALADFLRLDRDLLAAAAEGSPPLSATTPDTAALRRWVKALPELDKDEVVLRVLRGDDGAFLRSELLRRMHGAAEGDVAGVRTVGELLAAAEQAWARRREQGREREAAEQRRREQAAAAAQQVRLETLARDPDKAWRQVAGLIDTKKPKEYDTAVVLLQDLRMLAARGGDTAAFAQQMRRLREQHARKPSLLDRFDRAQLD